MTINRRNFLGKSALAAGAIGLAQCAPAKEETAQSPLSSLKSMTDGVALISNQERMTRLEKAAKLMTDNKIDAVYVEGGTAMDYFTGVRWGNSERMMAAIISSKGEVIYVGPHFEEQKIRELITIGKDLRTWDEHESPAKLVADVFKDLGIKSGRIGIEERVRFFLYDNIRKEAPHLEYLSADPVTIPCRMFKSAAELALMQKANDITIAAFKASFPLLKEGMTQGEFGGIISEAFSRLGSPGGAMVSFGVSTAFPHGSVVPQKVKTGDVVLVDGGCEVGGYASDITRTFIFGEPTARQREVWNLEKAAQAAGFAAAILGDPCENVDIAARKVITDAGFGPGYKVPGLPHRTGHGIGMDGHEWGNMVLGNKEPLSPGMCFSIEPNISIYGEFGIRLEDCAYMTESGAKWFSEPSPALESPFA